MGHIFFLKGNHFVYGHFSLAIFARYSKKRDRVIGRRRTYDGLMLSIELFQRIRPDRFASLLGNPRMKNQLLYGDPFWGVRHQQSSYHSLEFVGEERHCLTMLRRYPLVYLFQQSFPPLLRRHVVLPDGDKGQLTYHHAVKNDASVNRKRKLYNGTSKVRAPSTNKLQRSTSGP